METETITEFVLYKDLVMTAFMCGLLAYSLPYFTYQLCNLLKASAGPS